MIYVKFTLVPVKVELKGTRIEMEREVSSPLK